MKLIDVHFSFDTSKVTFAFSAEGRVDFRLLVRDLTGHFNRTIRLHQIGKRDEAKAIGDCGPCGRILCCKSFIKDFASITSKMAETQQVVHRGSERISGLCSRLKCCLQYEQEGYKELAKKLPNIGEEIEVEGEKATVVNCNVLKQTVDARFKNHSNGENHGDTVMEVDIENYTKKEK
jgi:cell fate regulator YaaT (PSP1 superfamily)